MLKKLLPYIILLTITGIFFYKTIFQGLIPFPADLLLSEYQPWRSFSYAGYNPGSIPNKAQYFDTIRQLFPWKMLVIDELKAGRLPTWNPYNFSGSPLFANHQSQVLYPFNIFYFLVDPRWAWAITVILQPLLASIFTYWFCRKIKLRKLSSILSAITFAYSQFMTVFLEYNTLGHVLIYLPLMLLFVEYLREKITWLRILGLVVAASLSFLAGHLQLHVLGVAFISLFAWFSSDNLPKRQLFLVSCALAIFLSLGLVAIQFLPTLELISHSARSNQPYQFLIEKLLVQPWQLGRIFAPDIFGNPATRSYLQPDTYPGKALAVGVIPLLLAAGTITLIKKNNLVKFFVLATVTITVLIVRSPLTEMIYRLPIPWLSTSNPANSIFLLSFSLSILSGFGLEFILGKKSAVSWIHIALLLTILGGLISTPLLLSQLISVKNLILPTSLLFSTLILILLKRHLPDLKVLPVALIMMTVFDLWYGFGKFNSFVPADYIFPSTPITSWLKEQINTDRFWGYGTASIEANFATAFRIYSPDGYDPLYPKWYGELLGTSEKGELIDSFSNANRSDAVLARGFGETDFSNNLNRQKLLRLLSVRYVLDKAENGSTEITFPIKDWKLLVNLGDFKIYNNRTSLPRANLVNSFSVATSAADFSQKFFATDFDPGQKTILFKSVNIGNSPILTYETAGYQTVNPTETLIQTTTADTRLLVISDAYYPGWHATIDDRATDILRANWAFRAIVVPPGEHIVRFVYKPLSLAYGAVITTVTGLVIIVIAIWRVYSNFFIVRAKSRTTLTKLLDSSLTCRSKNTKNE